MIFLNLIILSLDFYTTEHGKFEPGNIDEINFVFLAFFTAEVILKFFGLGFRSFIKDRFNIFDVFVVLVSIVEVILANGNDTFTFLRVFRLFRIFKFFRVGEMRVMIDSLNRTAKAIAPFVVCLFIFLYIFALIGMQFFAGKIKMDENEYRVDPNGKTTRYSFDDFINAFFVVFIFINGDNYPIPMHIGMLSTHPISCLYTIIVVLIGNIIILQLLVSIIISNFNDSRKLKKKRKILDQIENKILDGSDVQLAVREVIGDILDKMEKSKRTNSIKKTNNKDSEGLSP